MQILWAVILALGALAYGLYFLTFPVLNGLQAADGSAVSRAVFLSRVLLPDEWLREWTGAGHLPTAFGDRIAVWRSAGMWIAIAWWIGRPFFHRALVNVTRVEQAVFRFLLA